MTTTSVGLGFDEVTPVLTDEQAAEESARCYGCRQAPCVAGCPVGVDIPSFIAALKKGDRAGANAVIRDKNSLPAVCGRVCPQETQCEKNCIRGLKESPVRIGKLERYAAECAEEEKTAEPPRGKRVAVIGSGPAGLSCAGELAARGYRVTVFETLHKPGGVLVYGIPEFRLPKSVVAKEIARLERRGVEIVTNCAVGASVTLDELFEQGYSAAFVGSGAGLPVFLGIPGESLNGVFSANEFLTRVNLLGAYKPGAATPIPKSRRTVTIGGGNVAMDAARSALRLGAESVLLYRRTEGEMPARREEIEHAKAEGVKFKTLAAPVEILGKNRVEGIVCDIMELGEPDASGRRRPVPIGETFAMDCDCVIVAAGTNPNPLLRRATKDLEFNKWGCVVADERGKTSKPFVYAGGDAVTGAATVILAMGAGKTAAEAIDEQLTTNN